MQVEKQLTAEKEAFAKLAKAAQREPFACAADAQRHGAALLRENRYACHTIEAEVRAEPVYARGRPKQGAPRKVRTYRHRIHLRLRANSEAIARAREQAGCFVLLSNVPGAGQHGGLDGAAVLRAYKAQNGVEMNFRFLKDPVIVNETFLKKAERIEALGFILLLSLMVWNLIQKVLRDYLAKHRESILGWDKKQTRRPTTLMVIFYFQHVSVFKWNEGRNRRLSRPLLPHQRDYLQALGLPESIFITPVAMNLPQKLRK